MLNLTSSYFLTFLENITIMNPTLYDIKAGSQEDQKSTNEVAQAIILAVVLLMINSLLQNLLQMTKKKYPNRFTWINEQALTTLLGIVYALTLNALDLTKSLDILFLSFQNLFLILMLPLILFESAITVPRKKFFQNFGTILLFAILGTLLTTVITTVLFWLSSTVNLFYRRFSWNQCFAFSSIIAATDPVAVLAIFKSIGADQTLYVLIFGESILNDAVSVILFKIATNYSEKQAITFGSVTLQFAKLLLGSALIGYLMATITAFTHFTGQIFKKLKVSNTQQRSKNNIAIFIPIIAYLLGESLHLSGIVAILFCGIGMSRYTLPNLNESGQRQVKYFYTFFSRISEDFIFLFIGISLVNFDHPFSQMGLLLFIFVYVIINVVRYFMIQVISGLANRFRGHSAISSEYKLLMWFSGFRGAMAVALGMQAPLIYADHSIGKIFLSLILIYANINIFLFGSVIKPLVKSLDLKEKSFKPYLALPTSKRKATFLQRVKRKFAVFEREVLLKNLIRDDAQELTDYDDDDENEVFYSFVDDDYDFDNPQILRRNFRSQALLSVHDNQ